MAIYCIGDVHGCYTALQALLKKIRFNPQTDTLYFAGDFVNKGPRSYDTMRFIMDLPNAYSVLGNHDLHFLALSQDLLPQNKKHTMHDILERPECNVIIDWLRKQPFASQIGDILLVHAGIHPTWNIERTMEYSHNLSTHLQGPDWRILLKNMYGDTPNIWHDNLVGWERARCLINIFTRMRFLGSNYQLNFTETGTHASDSTLKPWFTYPLSISSDTKVVFGHWASLQGNIDHAQCIALDGGCVWGGKLMALACDHDHHPMLVVDQQGE